MMSEPISMPMAALREMVILPEMVVHFDVSRDRSIRAVAAAMEEEGQKIFLTAQREGDIDNPEKKDLYQVGCVASIKQVIKLPKNILRVLVSGEYRAKLQEPSPEKSPISTSKPFPNDTFLLMVAIFPAFLNILRQSATRTALAALPINGKSESGRWLAKP